MKWLKPAAQETVPVTAESGACRTKWEDWARAMLFGRLRKLRRGRLVIVDSAEQRVFGDQTPDASLQSVVLVHDARFYGQSLFGGSIGAAEAYMAGYWSCSDLTALVRILVSNRKALDTLDGAWAKITAPAHNLFHWLRRNTRKGSRANISAHYDLGNDFYALFLDETMTYSCGIFEDDRSTLREASLAKFDRICHKLELRPGDHLLEMGTGWGGFAIYAATHYGCRVTTTTVSRQQYQMARARIQEAGLQDRVELLLEDYRDLRGRYDKLVSIEMIEAVGHHYLETFFRCCSERLKPDGLMVLQAITIEDQLYKRQNRSADFIKRYIFPGSSIPSVTAITHAVGRATDIRLAHLEEITPHYVRTLQEWRRRFTKRLDAVRALGYPEEFIRMWEFYLCYCEGAFRERYTRSVQMILTKPDCLHEPRVPMLTQAHES
jgi:cyclopropane-fatty-acyl-phospholipid synthase